MAQRHHLSPIPGMQTPRCHGRQCRNEKGPDLWVLTFEGLAVSVIRNYVRLDCVIDLSDVDQEAPTCRVQQAQSERRADK